MTEIANCKCCGSVALPSVVRRQCFVECDNSECLASGPLRYIEAEAIAAWNELMGKAEPAAGSVRVRIPVVIDCDGEWCIDGVIDQQNGSWNSLGSRSDTPIAYITADIPLPVTAEIAGEVS